MEITELSNSIIAALGAVMGGVGLEVTRRLLNRSKEKSDVATAIRAELRAEIVGLKKEIDDLEHELDDWKAKYYQLKEEYLRARYSLEGELRERHSMPHSLLDRKDDGHDVG